MDIPHNTISIFFMDSVGICKNNCRFCPFPYMKDEHKQQFTLDSIKKFIFMNNPLRRSGLIFDIRISGMGDPLENPELIDYVTSLNNSGMLVNSIDINFLNSSVESMSPYEDILRMIQERINVNVTELHNKIKSESPLVEKWFENLKILLKDGIGEKIYLINYIKDEVDNDIYLKVLKDEAVKYLNEEELDCFNNEVIERSIPTLTDYYLYLLSVPSNDYNINIDSKNRIDAYDLGMNSTELAEKTEVITRVSKNARFKFTKEELLERNDFRIFIMPDGRFSNSCEGLISVVSYKDVVLDSYGGVSFFNSDAPNLYKKVCELSTT